MRIGSGQVVAALGDWSSGRGAALHRRLSAALAGAIEAGLLPRGGVLPAERRLAVALAVGRSTVTEALAELKAVGLIEARQGSVTRIVGPVATADPYPGAVVLPGLLADRAASDRATIDLAAAVPPDARSVLDLAVDDAALLVKAPRHGYAPEGIPALREAVARLFSARGAPTIPDQVLITNGGHHALALVLRHRCRPGTPLLVDDPAYPGLVDLLAAIGLEPVAVPRRGGGIDTGALASAVAASGATVACLQPVVHNPTGAVAADWELRRLAGAVDRLGLTVVEDLVLDDLRFDGDPPAPLAARVADQDRVVSVGSVSKTAWGGLRVGWLRADPSLIRRLTRLRLADDLGTGLPSQVLALAVMEQREAMVADRRERLRSRAALLVSSLAGALPSWRVDPIGGGLSAWVTLPGPLAGPLAQVASRHGVAVAIGASAGFPQRGDGPHPDRLRLCFDRPEPQLTEAVRRLAAAWAVLDVTPQRDWQRGHQVVVRPSIRAERSGAAQRRQGRPPLP